MSAKAWLQQVMRRNVKLCGMNDRQRESRTENNSSVRVLEFSREECPFSNRDHTWQQFHTFRNGVLDILSSYGSVGSMGKRPILDNAEESEDDWHISNRKPDFFVVDDDMYGMSVRVEAACALVKPVVLEELVMLLQQFEEWCVYLALSKGGLWVFHDRILFEGPVFAGCCSVKDLYRRCALGEDSRTITC
jgi:hypothetical protein